MIALSILIAALAVSTFASSSSSSSSTSSTDNNEHRKAEIAKNIKNFEARLNTAVSKALVEGALSGTDIQKFLKTYGIKSDKSFDKTFELLNAVADGARRKRNNAHDSSSSSSSSSSSNDVVEIENSVNDFLEELSQKDKDLFRISVLKQALAQHLQAGRDHHDADGNVGALLAEYTQWKQANKKLLENEKAKEELLGKKSAIKALWETSSD